MGGKIGIADRNNPAGTAGFFHDHFREFHGGAGAFIAGVPDPVGFGFDEVAQNPGQIPGIP